mmetsp:Transcript_4027/g.7178  ORF Transcript_4027/g.7178 Transcript_4027/m.7178 type:complete len:121 (-) Transcript_4027:430-792(-)
MGIAFPHTHPMSHSTILAKRFFTVKAIATKFNSELMPPPWGHIHSPSCPSSSYHQQDQLMMCPPSPLLIIQQYPSCMLFTCVSNYSFLPKTTTGCNWKNVQFYHPLTQLPVLNQHTPFSI